MQYAEIYTDGVSKEKHGKGSWATIVVTDDGEVEMHGSYTSTTTDRMELLAVINGLMALKEPSRVLINTKSKYIVNTVENSVENQFNATRSKHRNNIDLWETLFNLMQVHEVRFLWMKGSLKDEYNRRCIYLASTEFAKYG